MKAQFVMDGQGKKVGVLLPLKEYDKMIKELEDLDDIRSFDLARKEDDGKRILLADYLKKRKARNAKVHRQPH
jgi:molybdate-binding protein